MKRKVLLGGVFLVMAVLVMGSSQKAKRTQVAFHDISGALDGILTFAPFGPGVYDVHTLSICSGEVKGLGQSNLITIHRPAPKIVLEGQFFILAANGDKIQGTYEGTTEPGTKPKQIIGKADYVITKGTGRFANASGIIHATVYITSLGYNVWEWPATTVLEGTISY